MLFDTLSKLLSCSLLHVTRLQSHCLVAGSCPCCRPGVPACAAHHPPRHQVRQPAAGQGGSHQAGRPGHGQAAGGGGLSHAVLQGQRLLDGEDAGMRLYRLTIAAAQWECWQAVGCCLCMCSRGQPARRIEACFSQLVRSSRQGL